MSKKQAVISLSGGMDSTSLLVHLLAEGYQIKAVSFNYGQKHVIELERAQKNVDLLTKKFPEQLLSYEILDARPYFNTSKSALTSDTEVPEGHYEQENMSKTVVEGRNAFFSISTFIKAGCWAKDSGEKVVISLGIHAGDHQIYDDCRETFRDSMAETLRIGYPDCDVDYYVPYLHGNKTTILEDCLKNCEKLGLDFDTILANSNTSYNPDEQGRASGKSGADIERIEAFINIGRKDPVEYQDTWENIVSHAKEVLFIA